jgi:hypothetical protein
MRSRDRACVFDRAPVLLGAGGYLPDVGDQAVGDAAKYFAATAWRAGEFSPSSLQTRAL